jgi:anti-anti-sigma regulatory factor
MSAYELKSDGDKGVMALKGELGIEDAGGLKDGFLDAMEKHAELSVDLSEVESCNVAVLQLLLSVQRGLQAKGSELGCEGEVSEAVKESARAAGLLLGMHDNCFWRRG